MMFRKLFLVFAVVAGLCAFDATVETPRLPQVAQTELVVSGRQEQERVFSCESVVRKDRFILHNELLFVSFHHLYLQSLLVQTQQHHASLS
jgi:hypothetical protein